MKMCHYSRAIRKALRTLSLSLRGSSQIQSRHMPGHISIRMQTMYPPGIHSSSPCSIRLKAISLGVLVQPFLVSRFKRLTSHTVVLLTSRSGVPRRLRGSGSGYVVSGILMYVSFVFQSKHSAPFILLQPHLHNRCLAEIRARDLFAYEYPD